VRYEIMEVSKINTIPIEIHPRIDEMINHAWDIFLNHFVNKKYEINLEAPFQLHFASILKYVGELYCLKKGEVFAINLEVNMGDSKKNYIDIVIEFFERGSTSSLLIPIELKFRTVKQSAVDEGVMAIYRDIHTIEKVVKKGKYNGSTIPFGYFFIITDHQGYTKRAKSGLKIIFDTSDGYTAKKEHDYKYLDNKTGKKFHDKYGNIIFNNEHTFRWNLYEYEDASKHWFLKMKI
jgi:hypothetical protein